MKKAENGDGYILRLYESMNTRTNFKLNFGVPIKSAVLCDLQENELSEVDVEKRTIQLTAKAFEIITLKIKK